MSIEIEEAQSFDFDDLSSIEGEANDAAAVDVDDYLWNCFSIAISQK